MYFFSQLAVSTSGFHFMLQNMGCTSKTVDSIVTGYIFLMQFYWTSVTYCCN
jgi:hypothetical protein